MAYRFKQELLSGPDSIEDVIKIEPNIALVDPNKTSGRRHRQLLRDLVDTMFGLIDRLTSNTIRGLDQRVDDLTERDNIPAKYLVAGMKVSVLNNASAADALLGVDNGPAEFVLLRDSRGPLTVYRNAKALDFRTVQARYVRSDGPLDERLASYPFLALDGDPHAKDDVVKWIFPGNKTRLLQLRQAVPLAGQGTANPQPTGLENDPYYLNFSPLDSVKPFFQPLPYAQALSLAQDEQLPQGASLLITDRGAGLPDVFVVVIGPNQVATQDAYTVIQDADGWQYAAVQYDVYSNQTTPRAGGGAGYSDAQARLAQLNRTAAPAASLVTLTAESPEDYPTATAGHVFTIDPTGCDVGKFVRLALTATAGQPVFNAPPPAQPYKALGAVYGPNKALTYGIYVCVDCIEVLIIAD